MQTIYYTTTHFVRHTGNVVDLEEYRRKLALTREGNLAPQPEEREEPEGPRLHGESSLHQPDQFEFLMNMRRAVIHCVKKNPQPVDLRVLNNLGFVHVLPLLSTFRATARRHLKQARRTAVSILRACIDFPMCLLHCFR